MTRAAKEMTTGAKAGPQILASQVRGIFEVAVVAGLDRAALLRRIELDEATLLDTNATVPLEAHTRVWEALGELPQAETFGLDLAANIQLDHFGVVGWAIMNAPLAGDIVRSATRYQALLGDPNTPIIDETPDALVVHRAFEPRIARTRIAAELTIASTITFMRALADIDPSDVREVCFQHPAPADPSAHDRYFGLTVKWSCPETRLVISRAGADRPITKRNPELFAYLDKHAQELAKTIAPTLSSRVRGRIVDSLRGGEPTAAAVAKALGLSERTLQRRLKDEGVTFADLLDGVRRDLAMRYLGDDNLAVFEIAFLLGYAETSPFHRAFKRWTGESPTDYRGRSPR